MGFQSAETCFRLAGRDCDDGAGDLVSIMDYGAIGNGVADDTAAMNRWIAAGLASGARRLFLPMGTYKVTSTVTFPDADTEIVGCGDLSIIAASAAVAGSTIKLTGDRTKLHRLKVTKATATAGAAVLVSADWVTLYEVTATSAYSAVALGDSSSSATPEHCTVERCVLTGADTPLYGRTGSDDPALAYNRILDNEIISTGTRPGIEIWSGASLIQGNRVRNASFAGGTAGITVGKKGHQQILDNFIEGFSYGIEAGITGLGIDIVGNKILSCGTGISITSIGGIEEEAVVLANNDIVMTTSYPGGTQTCITMTGCRTATISGGSMLFDSDGDFTSAASRACYGVDADNDVDELNLVGVQFTNLAQGVRAGGAAGGAGRVTMTGCTWENVQYPINDTGGTASSGPTVTVVGGRMRNCYQSHHNYRASYIGVDVSRHSTHPALNKGFAQFNDGDSTVCTIRSCNFNGVLSTSFVSDANRAVTGNNYKRPTVERRDHEWMVGNVATYDLVVAEFATAGLTEPLDVPIVTYILGLSFRKTSSGVVTHGAAAPVAGTWAVGAKVYATAPASGGSIGWVCTTAGTPGTWKTWGAIA